ncbi:MAG: YfhO family protein, partial [Lachnospiraceae bacterium]|nr:YfhO family protein [Lachnospiraceae bacterium]
CVPVLDRIWHAGSDPLGYLTRYSFLLSFLMIRCAFEAFVLSDLDVVHTDAGPAGTISSAFRPSSGPAEETVPSPASVRNLIICFLILVAFFVIVIMRPCPYLDVKKKIVNGILLAAAMVFVLLRQNKKIPFGILTTAFSLLLFAELILNFTYIYRVQSMGQMGDSEYREAAAELRALATEDKKTALYRIIPDRNYTDNDAFLGGFSGVSVYSSLTPVSERLFLKRLGFHDNGLFTELHTGITDGVKEILCVSEKDRASAETKSVRMVSEDENDLWRGDPFRFAEGILNDFADADEKIYYDAQTDIRTEGDGSVMITVVPAEDGKVYFYLVGAEGAGNTLRLRWNHADAGPVNASVSLSAPEGPGTQFASPPADSEEDDLSDLGDTQPAGVGTVSSAGPAEGEKPQRLYRQDPLEEYYGNASNCRVMCLGEYHKGDSFELRIEGADEAQSAGLDKNLLIVTEKEEALELLKVKIDAQAGELRKDGASGFFGNIRTDERERIVFPLPYDKGFTVKLNGTKVQTERYAEEFLMAEVPQELKGEDITYTLSYLPEGFWAGIILGITGWILGAGGILLERRANGRH